MRPSSQAYLLDDMVDGSNRQFVCQFDCLVIGMCPDPTAISHASNNFTNVTSQESQSIT